MKPEVRPILAWPLPLHRGDASKPSAREAKRAYQKARHPLLQLVMNRKDIDRMNACARCFGIKPRDFLRFAVERSIHEAEQIFGIRIMDSALDFMSQDDFTNIASLYREVNSRLVFQRERKN